MKMCFSQLLFFVLVIGGLSGRNGLIAKPYVWVADGMERIGQTDAPGKEKRICIFAARGEYESFQVIVTAKEKSLTQVNLTISDLEGPQKISNSNFTLYREHYIEVKKSSPIWRGPPNLPLGVGWYPDGLIPFVDPQTRQDIQGAKYDAVPFDLAAGRNQPLWVDLLVPYNTLAGSYKGTATVSSDQGSEQLPVELTVWDFDLPLRPSLRSRFGGGELVLQHKLMGEGDYTRVNAINVGIWAGGGSWECLPIRPAAPVETWTEKESSYPEEARQYLYNYTTDEISNCRDLYEPVKEWARNIHAGSSIKNLIVMVPTPELYDDGTGHPAVDIWVVLPAQSYEPADVERIRQAERLGGEIWSYNCNVQDSYSPKWQIDFAPINYRIQPLINQSYGFPGLLYWRVDLWPEDPWTTFADLDYPGNGHLIYPGAPAGISEPVPSMRLKYLREGVEDYEYVEILKNLGQKDFALQAIQPVAGDWKHWTADPQALYRVRQILGEKIHQLQKKRGNG